MKKILFWLVISLFLILVSGVSFFITTETGLKIAFPYIIKYIPGNFSVASISGRLIGTVRVKNATYQHDNLYLYVNEAEIDWHPLSLLWKKLVITRFKAAKIRVTISPQKKGSTATMPRPPLPIITLPINIVINNLLFKDIMISYSQDASPIILKEFSLNARTSGSNVEIDKLTLQKSGSSLEFKGIVSLEGNYPFNLQTNWSIKPQADLNFKGTGKVSGTIDDLEVTQDVYSPFKAIIKARIKDRMNKINLQGEWNDLNWPLLKKEESLVSSPVGHIKVKGTIENYQFVLSSTLTGQTIPLGHWKAEGNGDSQGLSLDFLEGNLWDGKVKGHGSISWEPNLKWQLRLDGNEIDSGKTVEKWPGKIRINSIFSGEIKNNILQATIKIIQLKGELRGYPFSARTTLNINGDHYTLPIFQISSGPAQISASGDIYLHGQKRSEATLTASNLYLGFRPITSLKLSGVGTPSQHNVSLELVSQKDNIAINLKGSYEYPVWYGRVEESSLTFDPFGTWKLERPESLIVDNKRVEINRICWINKTSQFCLQANWVKDKGWEAFLKNSQAVIPALGITLKDIEIFLYGEEEDIIKVKGEVGSDPGKITLEGEIIPQPKKGLPVIRINLQGDHFELVRTQEFWALVSPQLTIDVQGDKVKTEGEIFIPEATITPRKTETAVSVSKDVLIINEKKVEEKGEKKWEVSTKVRLILGDKVQFKGSGLSGRIKGSVLIVEEPTGVTTGSGKLEIVDGVYQTYGQKLEISQGRLLFTGGPVNNPDLDIQAVRNVNTVKVGVNVQGTLQEPQLTLFSSPPMEQADILSYLLTGQALRNASSAEGKLLYNAARTLTISGGELIAKRIGSIFGIKDVSVEKGTNSGEVSLVIGRYLSPRLYLSYGIGLFEDVNTLQVRYQLTKRWLIKVESGFETGADLLYTVEW
ncbi:MAG: translocation/assembly module TamB domain-containing protein [bacterium]